MKSDPLSRHIFKMPKCQQCNRTYVKKHTCHAGNCKLCGRFFRKLLSHQCPISKFENAVLRPDELGLTKCDLCLHMFANHQMRKWLHNDIDHDALDFCKVCKHSDFEIQNAIEETSRIVHGYVNWKFGNPNLTCAFCDAKLILVRTIYGRILNYELDHRDPTQKTGNVGIMIFNGICTNQILDEVDRCRAICLSCHSIKTSIERKMGIPRVLQYQTMAQKKKTLDNLIAQTKLCITMFQS